MFIKKYFFLFAIAFVAIAIPLTTLVVQHQQIINQNAAGNNCNHTGVTKNGNTYSFAKLLVDSQGILRDTSGCQIYLLGGQGKGPSPTLQGQLQVNNPSQFTYLPQWNKLVKMNLLRIVLTVQNWTSNPTMPGIGPGGASESYQWFVQNYVHYIEQQGQYVELDLYQQGNAQAELQALPSILQAFQGDTAVFYDVRNEAYPNGDSCTQGMNEDFSFLKKIQDFDPTILKVTYVNCVDQMIADPKTYPFYTASSSAITNLLMDGHMYSGYVGPDPYHPKLTCNEPGNPNDKQGGWPAGLQKDATVTVPFFHANHAGFMHGEWGGCYDYTNWQGYDYHDSMMQSTVCLNIAGLSYYFPSGLFTNQQLNQNGINVNTSYTAIFNNALSCNGGKPSVTSSSSPPPTTTPKPTVSISPTPQASCNHTGVTKNQGGKYTFAKLYVDTHGILRDGTNCEIYLLGVQGKGANPYNSGQYTLHDPSEFSYLDQITQHLTMNELRVPITVTNWNANPFMSNINAYYHTFIQEYVTYIEQQGDYIQFDIYQDATPKEGETAIASLAKTFQTDPAVFYDVRNESLQQGESCTQGLNENYQWLEAIQNVDPTILKGVYVNCLQEMIASPSLYPFYTASSSAITNLFLDGHIYSGYKGSNPFHPNRTCNEPNDPYGKDGGWPALLQRDKSVSVPFLQKNHAALVHNEWGGCFDYTNWQPTGVPGQPTPPPAPDYHDMMIQSVFDNNLAGLSYFYYDDLFLNNQLNQNGINVTNGYTKIFSLVPLSGTPIPTDTPLPTSTVSPTPTVTPTGVSGTPTPTPRTNGTNVFVTVGLHGIGNGGDNENPQSKGTMNPQHPVRDVLITFVSLQGTIAATGTGQITFDSASDSAQGLFTGIVTLATSLNGDYLIRIKSNGFLERQLSSVVSLSQPRMQQKPVIIPPVYLVSGDLNNDNKLDLLDYNILVGCYGVKQNDPASCPAQFQTTPSQVGADLLDDGIQPGDESAVDGADYNLFVRELSIQNGE